MFRFLTPVFVLRCAIVLAQSDASDGNGSIRGRCGDSDIVITTTARLAGAIHSLTWNGKEFIDSADHGRQLQSASNFDAGSAFTSETFNPTEAGSMHDGPGEQKHPVALSTEAGDFALGIYAPDQPSKGFENAGYGRWYFGPQHVVKWNCVFRIRDVNGIAARDYSFRMFVIIGTLEDVRISIIRLHSANAGQFPV